jgi:hypothetical protein
VHLQQQVGAGAALGQGPTTGAGRGVSATPRM